MAKGDVSGLEREVKADTYSDGLVCVLSIPASPVCALSSNVCGIQNTSTIPTKRAGKMKAKARRGFNEEWRVFGGVGQVRCL